MAATGEVDFCTLGMFIIDEIEFAPPKPPVKDIAGGAGSYSALGARIFSPSPKSQAVGWIVDCGSDFPSELRDFIAQWDTGVLIRETPERLTTRGWNGYGEHEHRAFRYTTPKLRLDQHDLVDTQLLWSKSFHLICSPLRCIDLVRSILALRRQPSDAGLTSRPLFIWEPVPDLCTVEELDDCLKALKYVDVVSPNHGELGGFFGKDTNAEHSVDFRLIEELCGQWLGSGIGADGQGGIVLRCGKDGCLVTRNGVRKWLPAYHQSSTKVVDPTGGGNGFLGGLAIGLVRAGDTPGIEHLEEAAIWGSISASFAIEQVGMPVLSHGPQGETWNSVRVEDRLSEFKSRLPRYIQP
ncbi:Ribokinase-like protein [Cucurbitaria berberidis CBS 394.84]|uniref:Ribokinase-like protein n=1 Tax=Cucurbitaria berberidis CBS 394.84 TaxID=1168544 RepID=A0A9P4GS33_9PLEO|nr:Ribokinase-like protein [Cucurbitaria berberidis CBS 394.84]KAF1850787.1 Ribokinase-like protein [Cucurbitaria berberidis CBS 394.84]